MGEEKKGGYGEKRGEGGGREGGGERRRGGRVEGERVEGKIEVGVKTLWFEPITLLCIQVHMPALLDL